MDFGQDGYRWPEPVERTKSTMIFTTSAGRFSCTKWPPPVRIPIGACAPSSTLI